MKEIQTTIYVAEDGKEFITKEECLKHENKIADKKEVIKCFNTILDYCKRYCDEEADGYLGYNICNNTECPFWNGCCKQNCLFESLPYCDFNKIGE